MFGPIAWIWLGLAILAVKGGPIPRSNPRNTCFICPTKDDGDFALGAAVYTPEAPIYCQYPQSAMDEEYHFFCLFSQLTGTLVEDANDGGCPPVAEQTQCNRGKATLPQHSFMSNPSLDNPWVNLAKRSAPSGRLAGIGLRANAAARRAGEEKAAGRHH